MGDEAAAEDEQQPRCDWPANCAFPDCGCPAAYGHIGSTDIAD